MKLHALALFVFLAWISYCLGVNMTALSTPTAGKPSKSADDTQQQESYTNLPTKKPTKPSNGTTTKLPDTTKSGKPVSGGTKDTNTATTASAKKKNPTASRKNTVTTPKHKPSTAPKIEIQCQTRNESCSKCLKGSGCFYCDSDKTCKKMTGKIIPTGCKGNKWYWKQCNVLGNILIIVIPTVGGVLLIMLGCCIYCCCCRRCSRNRATQEERRQQQRRVDRQERNSERKQDRKARHDAIRMKYGLLQNMDDDDDDADPLA